MANIILIAAIGKNFELGKNNDLIWKIKEDMQFFQKHTTGHKIVMGYNTFISLGKLLPKREHIVLTHRNLQREDILVFHDYSTLKQYLSSIDETVYIIGGASIYKLFLDEANELLLTEIHETCSDATTFFPKFSYELFKKEILSTHQENGIIYEHSKYIKKK